MGERSKLGEELVNMALKEHITNELKSVQSTICVLQERRLILQAQLAGVEEKEKEYRRAEKEMMKKIEEQ